MNAIMAAKMRRNLEFDTPYTVTNALSKGGAETKLSALIMGLGNMAHKQVLKGLLFLAAEVAYIAFMVHKRRTQPANAHHAGQRGAPGGVERGAAGV